MTYDSRRPAQAARGFRGDAVEGEIDRVSGLIPDAELRRLFGNCFPNTPDTTVSPGREDTFVITGEIDAMWLRDSGYPIWPTCRWRRRTRVCCGGCRFRGDAVEGGVRRVSGREAG